MTNNQKGITLVALVITIIILLILAGISILSLTDNGLFEKTEEAKEKSEISNEKEIIKLSVMQAMGESENGNIEKENLEKALTKFIDNYTTSKVDEGIIITLKSKRTYLIDQDGNVTKYLSEPEKSDEDLKTMLYGVIEIEFLNGTGYDIIQNPNVPILKDGMKAVYWAKNEDGEIDIENPVNNIIEITSDDENFKKENWYEYILQNENKDERKSRWANAITEDGSYYVWIPRYSYRIIYFDSEENENKYREGKLKEDDALAKGYIVGYSDARGIVNAKGLRPKDVESSITYPTNEKYFRTHPVFDGNVNKGGWDSKLEGIWVMKYEASVVSKKLKSIPNVNSKVGINANSMFILARDAYNKNGELNTTLNSHMMKNSEWGAVSYLTESKYGRNGTEVSANQCTGKITGAGRGLGDNQIFNSNYAVNSETKLPETEQQYNGAIGQLSSTTGNIYGIYDLSAGVWEYVMGFYGTDENNISFGSSGFTIENFPDKKYYQIYSEDSNVGNYLGDALYETNKWYGDNASLVSSAAPIFWRGAYYGNQDKSAGIFTIRGYHAGVNWGCGFRGCLAIK